MSDAVGSRLRFPHLVLAVLLALAVYLALLTHRPDPDALAAKYEHEDRVNRYTHEQGKCPLEDELQDGPDLIALLEGVRIQQLHATLERYQAAAESDYRCDGYSAYEVRRLADFVAESGDEQKSHMGTLELWLASSPDSHVPHEMFGAILVSEGYRQRGTKLGKDVSEAQWAGMRKAFDDAEASLERALELNPKSIAAYSSYFRLIRAGRSKDHAPALLDRVVENEVASQRVFRKYMEAVDPRWGGRMELIEEGIAKARPYMARNPRLRMLVGEPYHVQASIAMRGERYQEAVNLWSIALEFADSSRWHYLKGKALASMRQNVAAVKEYDKAIAIYPDYFDAHLARGSSHLYVGFNADALADYGRAIEIDPTRDDALVGRAQAHERLGHYEDAVGDFSGAIELSQGKPSAYRLFRIGEIQLYRLELHRDAEATFHRLLEHYPDSSRGWHRYGTTLHRLGDPRARQALEHYLSVADETSELHGESIPEARKLLGLKSEQESRPAPTLPGLASVSGGRGE